MIIQYIGLGTTTLPDFTNITRTLVNGDTIQVEDLTGEQLTQMYPSNWRNAQPINPGGSGLSTYPISKIQFSLNPDGLSCGIFDGTDAVSLSNGKVWYDGNITLPPFPAIPVTPGFGLPLALWSYDDGSTIQYEWTYGPEVDVTGIIPPINFLGNTTPGAMFIGSALCINFTGAPKTPGVDTFNNFDDWFFNRLEAIYEEWSIDANPGYYLYTTGSGSIRNNVEFNYYTFDGGQNEPVGTQPDDTYAQGIVIPNGESMAFRIVLSQGVIFIVPNFMAIQAVDTLAFVGLNNNTGSDWTWGVNDLNDVVSGIQNVSSSSYIGEYASLLALANGTLVPVEGQTALVGGTLYEYLQGTWTVGQVTVETDWINISQSDILSIVSTPLTLLPAPGAGKALLVQQFLLNFIAGGTPYTYASNMFLNMGANTIFNLGNPLTGASVLKTVGGQSATLTENTSVVLTGGGSDPTLGNGTMKIKLFYTIETL